jgi:tetratricopeptide (TPR) repeat protein
VLERQGNDVLALETLRQALVIDPTNRPASLRAAWILYQVERDEEAGKFLGQVLSAGKAPSDPLSLKASALVAMINGDKDRAGNLLNSVLQKEPRDIEALEWIVQNETDRNQLEDALNHVSQCLKLDRSYPFCHYQRIELLIRKNDFDQSRRAYQEALQSTHGYPWLHCLGGYIELGSGNLDAAEREFLTLERDGRQKANEVYFRASQDGLAQIALVREDFAKAQNLMEGAISVSSSDSEKAQYHLDLVAIAFLANKPIDASRIEREVSIQKPDEYMNAAIRKLAFAGQMKEAHGLISQVKNTAPLGTDLVATKSFLDGIDLLHSGGDVSNAFNRIRQAYELDPDPLFMFTLFRAQMAQHDCTGAKGSLHRLSDQKGVILLDSYAALLPIAMRDLNACITR